MMLWIILTVMCSSAAVLLAAPFLRQSDQRLAKSAPDLAVFRDQLEEIKRESAEGLIDTDQAEVARNEIARRAAAAARISKSLSSHQSPHGAGFAIVGIIAIVVLASTGLYAINGRPDLSSASAAKATGDPVAQLAAMTGQDQPAPGGGLQGAAGGLGTVEEMIERLALRLRTSPNDPEGWRMLGWSYASTNRFGEAIDAYAKAVALRPDLAALRVSFGEALVHSANGTVTPKARTEFEAALKLDLQDVRARYFIGLAKKQDGNKAAALDDWIAILKDAGSGDEWVHELTQSAKLLAQEVGLDVSSKLAGLNELKLVGVDKQNDLPADEQNRMIRGMVESLANRLEKMPNDEEGWIKLIRSYSVLREFDAAGNALRRALEVFADGTAARARIVSAAKDFGVAKP